MRCVLGYQGRVNKRCGRAAGRRETPPHEKRPNKAGFQAESRFAEGPPRTDSIAFDGISMGKVARRRLSLRSSFRIPLFAWMVRAAGRRRSKHIAEKPRELGNA
jgi:hypothetical protein